MNAPALLQIAGPSEIISFGAQVRCLAGVTAREAFLVWDEAVRVAESQASSVSSQVVYATYRRFQSEKATASSSFRKPIQLQSATAHWYTPPSILGLVRQVLEGGVIDLDPCTDHIAQQRIGACHIFTEDLDGLKQNWFCRVYVNPPFGIV